jgi:hypothetical protein
VNGGDVDPGDGTTEAWTGAFVTSTEIEAAEGPAPLRIYLRYEYLSAYEVSGLLAGVGGVFDQLFWAELPALVGRRPNPVNHLRVSRIETGQSILIFLQAIGQTVNSVDPTLRAVAGGAFVASLTARLMIHTLTTGHNALAAAQRRNLELEEQRRQLEERRDRARLEVEVAEVDLAVTQHDADFRNFVQSAIRATTSSDFAAMAARREDLTERLGSALLEVYSVLEHDNITQARINDVEVKSDESGS